MYDAASPSLGLRPGSGSDSVLAITSPRSVRLPPFLIRLLPTLNEIQTTTLALLPIPLDVFPVRGIIV